MSSPIVESFSFSHAALLDGSTTSEKAALYGVREGTVSIDSDSYSNTGDNTILSVWNWFNLATVSITSGFLPFDTLSKISGATVASSGVTPSDYWSVSLWNQSSLNQPSNSLILRAPARKSNGSIGILDFILYKVYFQPLQIEGPSYKNGIVFSVTGQATMSSTDELGNTLADPAVGRLRYSPRSIIVPALNVVNNNDGTYTVTGSSVVDNGNGTYTISSSQLTDNGNGTYTLQY